MSNTHELPLADVLSWEMETSFLDLLCEDGFISPAAEAPHTPSAQLALWKQALRHGFLTASHHHLPSSQKCSAQWVQAILHGIYLRAPPCYRRVPFIILT